MGELHKKLSEDFPDFIDTITKGDLPEDLRYPLDHKKVKDLYKEIEAKQIDAFLSPTVRFSLLRSDLMCTRT